MTTYFKATRMDGTDFYSGHIHYGSALKTKITLKHPNPGESGERRASNYFSVATIATDCTSFSWPARLFEVELVGEEWAPSADLPNKRAGTALKVLRELPAWQLFGPRGESIVAILDKFEAMTYLERDAVYRARPAGWSEAYNRLWSVVNGGRAFRAGLDAAQDSLRVRLGGGWGVGGCAAYGAALAVLCKDLITAEDYDVLIAPYGTVLAGASI